MGRRARSTLWRGTLTATREASEVRIHTELHARFKSLPGSVRRRTLRRLTVSNREAPLAWQRWFVHAKEKRAQCTGLSFFADCIYFIH